MRIRALLIALLMAMAIAAPSSANLVMLQTNDGKQVSTSNPLPTTVSGVAPTSPMPVTGGGVAQASILNVTAAIAASDTTISFGGSYSHVIIKTDTGAAAIFVDLSNNTATNTDFKMDSGGALQYVGGPITGFHYLGASVAGNISYLAW